MRVAASLVSISLLVLPVLQLPVHAGLSAERSLIAQKQEAPQRQVTDYYPDDPLWKRLDAENQAVINHFGFHALYELMVYRRRLLRGADAAGLDLALPVQKENPIPDDDWFLLMNTSQVLNMLYPQELEELRRYGFDAFEIANTRGLLIEDQLKDSISNDSEKDLFNKAFSFSPEEKIDQLIKQFMGSPDKRWQATKNYEGIASLILEPSDLSPKSLDFLATYSNRLFLDGHYDQSLAVARQVSGLALEKWGADSFASYEAVARLVDAENVIKSKSVSGRGEFKYTLSEKLLASVDSLIALTRKWWGPASPKSIPLLVTKAEFTERDEQIPGVQRNAEVIRLMRQAEVLYLAAKKQSLFPDANSEIAADQEIRSVIMNSLFAAVRKGDYTNAYELIVRFKAFPFHSDTTDQSISFGSLFSDLVNIGKYAQMIEIAERLISLFESKQIVLDVGELSELRLALANCYVYVGRFEEFEALYPRLDQGNWNVKTLRALSKLNQGILPEVQYPLSSLAFTPNSFDFESSALQYMIAMIVEYANGNYPKSIAAGEALYSAVVANPSSIRPQDVAKGLSVVHFASGNKTAGLNYLQKTVMHMDQQSDDASLDGKIGIPRLKLSLVDQRFDESRDKGKTIFVLWLGQLQTELTRMPLQERTAYLQSLSATIQDTEALNLLLSDRTFLAASPDLPLFYVLNRKGLLEELEKRQRGLLNVDPSAQSIVQNLRGKQKRVADGALRGEELNALQLEINALERQLYRVLPKLQPRTFSVQQVSQALPSDGALVEYVRFQWADPVDPLNTKQHYAAFVLKSNARVSFVPLGEAEAIDSSIAVAVDALEQQFSDSEVLLQKALDRVLLPLRSELAGVRALYLSPDGELNRLPFAAASLDGGTSVLADQVDLRIVTTGRELLQLQEGNATATSPAVVVANPAFDRAGAAAAKNSSKGSGSSSNQDSPSSSGTQRALGLDQIWTRLQYTQEEGQNTSDLLGGALLTGDQASTANVKAIRSPRIAHFATHGYFMPDEQRTQTDPLAVSSILPIKIQPTSAASNPLLRSGIVMAGANQPDADPNDDGYLTALEVLQLDWQGTELVVVSACESGRGLVKRGEGMYGLKRAFAVAGARSSLLSLWKVDDQATAAFMQSFYQRLKQGKGKGDALAETQQEFRNHPIAGWRHPYVWAAFQLSGDWGPIKGL